MLVISGVLLMGVPTMVQGLFSSVSGGLQETASTPPS
jgi:hypothetical protein